MTNAGNLFKVTADYASVQTNTEIKSAPTNTEMSLFITDIIISNGATAGQVKLVEKTASPTDVVENLHFGANGGIVSNFSQPIKLTKGENLGVTSTTADDFSVTIVGYEGF